MPEIMIVLGSPRREGNTAYVVGLVADAARRGGAEVEVVDAAHMNIGPCVSCFSCQKSDRYECVQPDDMKPLYARLPKADVLVLATPVFWFGPTAQMKTFWDRLYACVKFKADEGRFVSCFKRNLRVAAIITAGGDAFDGADLIVAALRHSAEAMCGQWEGAFFAGECLKTAEVKEDVGLRKRAEAFGLSLAAK